MRIGLLNIIVSLAVSWPFHHKKPEVPPAPPRIVLPSPELLDAIAHCASYGEAGSSMAYVYFGEDGATGYGSSCLQAWQDWKTAVPPKGFYRTRS